MVCVLASACHHEDPIGDGGLDLGAGDGNGDTTLVITPQNPVLVVVAGQPAPSLAFTATVGGVAVAATWQTDRGELGSIDSAGLYQATGNLGGKSLVKASYEGQSATTVITVEYKLTENGDPFCITPPTVGKGGYQGVGGNGPGCAATPAQVAALDGPATADPAVQWLYPYDGTVFPRGLLAPLLMWNRATHNFEAARLEMTAKGGTYVYSGTFTKPAGKPFDNLPIPQATWESMNLSSSGDEVTITVKWLEGTTVTGPVTLKWRIAAGTLKGVVYYNSYGTSLVTNSGENDKNGKNFGAGILAIQPGRTDPTLVGGKPSADASGCRVCHSVAKDGSRLITQTPANSDQDSRLIELKSGNTESTLAAGNSAFPAMYPDGSRFFTSSGGMRNGDTTSRLYTLPAGTLVPSPPGLPANLQAALPAFSPDGTQLVFNNYGGTGSDMRSLATMSFDVATNAFGAVTPLVTPASDYKAVWPSFLPTNKGVVYETELKTNEFAYTRGGNLGELWWVDLATKTAHTLDQLNGVGYLPTGPMHATDTQLNYEPTVNPVPTGGYAWVVFTSRRLYGNVATMDPFLSDPRNYDWTAQTTTKKLWVAALDLNAMPGTDPSHPAFYLPAQEILAGNSRGFWTVDPCHVDGTACVTGDECCGGYCQTTTTNGMTALSCTSTPPLCAKEFEKCTTDADCCKLDPSIDPTGEVSPTCIGGYCSAQTPVPIL
jgi:hypothetical protein